MWGKSGPSEVPTLGESMSAALSLGSPGWTRACYGDQAGFELAVILLPLLQNAGIPSVYHYALLKKILIIKFFFSKDSCSLGWP